MACIAFEPVEGHVTPLLLKLMSGCEGGAFDPLGLSKNSAVLEENKLKELKNGRLAMLAFIGFVSQQAVTKQSPLQALGTHLADPWKNNFATNGVSLPLPKSWL